MKNKHILGITKWNSTKIDCFQMGILKYFNIGKIKLKFLCLKKEVLLKQEVSTIAQ